MKYRALIINYNRLILPLTMANWLYARDIDPVFIDNNSDYPPLLEFYKNSPYEVLQLDKNYGHMVVWMGQLQIIKQLRITGCYIVTDPDLSLEGIPDDFIDVLNRGLEKYKSYDKCALSLDIQDLPQSKEGNFIRLHEAKYWNKPLDAMYFHADTDTTLALYRPGAGYSHSAIRANKPYTAKHIPWYYTDFNLLSDEEKYYFNSANESSSGKTRLCNR
jgi:hypothetical protein